MIERKLNVEPKYTDLFEEALGKIYKVNTNYKTMLIINELFKNKEMSEEDKDEKSMNLLLGKENWQEIKKYIESQPNYNENIVVAKCEIFSIAYNQEFDVFAARFQQATNAQ